jgi:hypothetical protein
MRDVPYREVVGPLADKGAEPQITNKASFHATTSYLFIEQRRRIARIYTTSASFSDSRYLVRDKLTSVSELRG